MRGSSRVTVDRQPLGALREMIVQIAEDKVNRYVGSVITPRQKIKNFLFGRITPGDPQGQPSIRHWLQVSSFG